MRTNNDDLKALMTGSLAENGKSKCGGSRGRPRPHAGDPWVSTVGMSIAALDRLVSNALV